MNTVTKTTYIAGFGNKVLSYILKDDGRVSVELRAVPSLPRFFLQDGKGRSFHNGGENSQPSKSRSAFIIHGFSGRYDLLMRNKSRNDMAVTVTVGYESAILSQSEIEWVESEKDEKVKQEDEPIEYQEQTGVKQEEEIEHRVESPTTVDHKQMAEQKIESKDVPKVARNSRNLTDRESKRRGIIKTEPLQLIKPKEEIALGSVGFYKSEDLLQIENELRQLFEGNILDTIEECLAVGDYNMAIFKIVEGLDRLIISTRTSDLRRNKLIGRLLHYLDILMKDIDWNETFSTGSLVNVQKLKDKLNALDFDIGFIEKVSNDDISIELQRRMP